MRVVFSQTSVICFCRWFSCCPFYRGVRYSEVSERRELTVFRILPIYLTDSFHLQYKHSGTFANRKYEELSYPKIKKMCDPLSSNSIENVTPSSGTSPLASYREVSPPGGRFDLKQISKRRSRSWVERSQVLCEPILNKKWSALDWHRKIWD